MLRRKCPQTEATASYVCRTASLTFAVLTAVAVLSGCGIKKISTNTALDANSDYAIVVVAIRPDVNPRTIADMHGENKNGMGYDLIWRRYDPKLDVVSNRPPIPDSFAARMGLLSWLQSCTLIDNWTYCISEVEPGYYVMHTSNISQERIENGRKVRYLAGRSSLWEKYTLKDGKVSQSGAQRFEIKAGKVYYLGEYSLSRYAQITDMQFNFGRTRQLLERYPNIKGSLVKPDFLEPYRLQLRYHDCAHRLVAESAEEYGTGNPCE